MNNLFPLLYAQKDNYHFPRMRSPISSPFGKVFIHDGSHLLFAHLSNIGVDGMYIEHLDYFPEGSPVKLVIKSDFFRESIQLRGMIIKLEPKKGTAIEFFSYFRNAKEVIQAAVLTTPWHDFLEYLQWGQVKVSQHRPSR